MAPARGLGPVLVVDDEELLRRGIVRFLHIKGFEASAVAGAESALDMLRRRVVRVVVVDWKLKDSPMDGLQLLAVISEKYPKIGRILMTGHLHLKAPPGTTLLLKTDAHDVLVDRIRELL